MTCGASLAPAPSGLYHLLVALNVLLAVSLVLRRSGRHGQAYGASQARQAQRCLRVDIWPAERNPSSASSSWPRAIDTLAGTIPATASTTTCQPTLSLLSPACLTARSQDLTVFVQTPSGPVPTAPGLSEHVQTIILPLQHPDLPSLPSHPSCRISASEIFATVRLRGLPRPAIRGKPRTFNRQLPWRDCPTSGGAPRPRARGVYTGRPHARSGISGSGPGVSQ